jgi:hypothetical protein
MDIDEIMQKLETLSKPQLEKLIENLDHIAFNFTINMSYLKYGTHPITIPKEVYHFIRVHKIVPNQEMRITFPDGSTATGYIYYGSAGWGKFYQIKVKQTHSIRGKGASQFAIGDRIKVEILRPSEGKGIRLSMVK